MKICKELKKALELPSFFDTVGGCGVDTSNGESPCMADVGVWFKYCPFCGKEIRNKFKNSKWTWWEKPNERI